MGSAPRGIASTAAPSRPAEGGAPPAPFGGYLAKLGDGLLGRKWKRRYAVLDAGVLSYYESLADYEGGAAPIKGNRLCVNLFRVRRGGGGGDSGGADLLLEPREGLGAAAHAGGGRVWKWRCESQADLEAWAQALARHGAVEGASGGSGGVGPVRGG